MISEDPDADLAVTRLAAHLLEDLDGLVEAATSCAKYEMPELQHRLLAAGEDPAAVLASIAEIVVRGLSTEAAEMPLEVAVRARMVGERLARSAVGLDSILEMADHVLRQAEVRLLEAAAAVSTPELAVAAIRRLNRLGAGLTLTLTRAYLETSLGGHLEKERALRALITIARAVARSLEPAEVAEAGLTETVGATDLDAGAVWLVNDSKHGLALQRTVGLAAAEIEMLESIDLTAHPDIFTSLQSGLPRQLAFEDEVPLLSAYRSALIVPLRGSSGLLGMMALGSLARRVFTPDEVIFAGAVADHMATALDHALEHRLEAHTDYLTGLANRAEFESTVRRELASAQRSRRPLAILLMDLDGLKQINDGQGHHAGDEAIRAVGQVLRQVVRTSDISARLGGDEFGVAMPEAGLAQAQEVVSRIRKSLHELNQGTERPFAIELSYGMAQWEPGLDFLSLYKAADGHLYSDKRRNHALRRGAADRPKIEPSRASTNPVPSKRSSSPETPSR